MLSHLPRMGVRRWHAVREHLASPLELLEMNSATLRAMGLEARTCEVIAAWQGRDAGHPEVAEVVTIRARCAAAGIGILPWDSPLYPEALSAIHDAPLVLYTRGDATLLQRSQIGIVGSRSASRTGLEHAAQFAAALSERGYLVTSGLALGVDGAAHAGALDAGFPTIAVIGTGVDVVYPRQHQALTERIADEGLMVSELPPGTPARAAHFPQRNRIISGLSRGVLVVEASPRSGSLITARLALEQGREVFAIPGSIHNPQARGCHQLIRQGATLVETVADIEEELSAWSTTRPAVKPAVRRKPTPAKEVAAAVEPPLAGLVPAGLEAREIAVLEALGYDPASTDVLCTATGLPADELMQSLLLLEMEGLVDSAPGGYQRLA
ncbi:DNA-processing protein DprA [Marinobacter sp.]